MITISTNVAVAAGSIMMFAGFMIGYAIAWRQRRSEPATVTCDRYLQFGGPLDLSDLRPLPESAEERVRRSQA